MLVLMFVGRWGGCLRCGIVILTIVFGFDIVVCNVLKALIRVIERRGMGEVVVGAKWGEVWSVGGLVFSIGTFLTIIPSQECRNSVRSISALFVLPIIQVQWR